MGKYPVPLPWEKLNVFSHRIQYRVNLMWVKVHVHISKGRTNKQTSILIERLILQDGVS